jgi:hypothetical protein
MRKSLPKVNEEVKPVPEVTENTPPLPKPSVKKIASPKVGNPANMAQFGDVEIELKPTKIKYQRDRTAAFYRMLKQMPLVDILALQDGILDPERSSDKMLFDWLIAVTDDPKIVTANYDKLDSESIYKILEIFCRLNHIPEDEKKQKAQTEKA